MADFAWEVLLLDALEIDDPDHADGPSDLLPLVRWAVEDARRLRQALDQIRSVIESVESDAWTDGEDEGHPLWRALDQVDAILIGVKCRRREWDGTVDLDWAEQRARLATDNGHAETPPKSHQNGSDRA